MCIIMFACLCVMFACMSFFVMIVCVCVCACVCVCVCLGAPVGEMALV